MDRRSGKASGTLPGIQSSIRASTYPIDGPVLSFGRNISVTTPSWLPARRDLSGGMVIFQPAQIWEEFFDLITIRITVSDAACCFGGNLSPHLAPSSIPKAKLRVEVTVFGGFAIWRFVALPRHMT
jgi:hypothetical protein